MTLTPTATTLKVTESGTTEGATVQLSATVASTATSTPLTGNVTFYFETFTSQGTIDLGGTLGSVSLTPTTSGPEGGTASLTATVPSGATGAAKIGAFYAGDVHYLASWSALTATTATSTLSLCPTAVTLAPSTSGLTFQTIGGVPPVSLSIQNDSTCGPAASGHGFVCSSFSDAGVFTAGPEPGTAQILAIDTDNAEAVATVTVEADAGAGVPAVSCSGDAGADAGPSDASVGPIDATTGADAAGGNGAGPGASSSGCGCVTAGTGGGLAGAGWAATLVGLVALRVRRRRR